MQSRGSSLIIIRAYFCLKERPTDQIPFPQSTAPLFFSGLCSSLTLCTLLSNFDCTGYSSLFINYSGRSNHCHFFTLSIDAPRVTKSARFICSTISLNDSRLLCDLSNLPHLVGNENYPRFPGITHPVQCHHTVHPHVHGSNGPLL